MTTPDIPDLCRRLRAFHAGGYRKEAADTLERQAAEIERLREALPDLSAVINWLAKGCTVDHAVTELIIYQARIDAARAALTGEDS